MLSATGILVKTGPLPRYEWYLQYHPPPAIIGRPKETISRNPGPVRETWRPGAIPVRSPGPADSRKHRSLNGPGQAGKPFLPTDESEFPRKTARMARLHRVFIAPGTLGPWIQRKTENRAPAPSRFRTPGSKLWGEWRVRFLACVPRSRRPCRTPAFPSPGRCGSHGSSRRTPCGSCPPT